MRPESVDVVIRERGTHRHEVIATARRDRFGVARVRGPDAAEVRDLAERIERLSKQRRPSRAATSKAGDRTPTGRQGRGRWSAAIVAGGALVAVVVLAVLLLL